MASRLELHNELRKVLGSDFVYFQPPTSMIMSYPAIKYSLNGINNDFANDEVYNQKRSYQVTVIDEDPDSEIVGRVSKLPTCRFDRHYAADNLNHTVFTIFY